jgi:predicted KAP-like P-loop ATPase
MWSDNDTAEDLIGFRVHAELIRDVVGDDTVLPVTIGVFGDWGSGKTSIMKMLQAELAKNEQIAVVYFDAWLFEGYDDAKSALISSILKQLMGNKRFPAELKDKARQLDALNENGLGQCGVARRLGLCDRRRYRRAGCDDWP